MDTYYKNRLRDFEILGSSISARNEWKHGQRETDAKRTKAALSDNIFRARLDWWKPSGTRCRIMDITLTTIKIKSTNFWSCSVGHPMASSRRIGKRTINLYYFGKSLDHLDISMRTWTTLKLRFIIEILFWSIDYWWYEWSFNFLFNKLLVTNSEDSVEMPDIKISFITIFVSRCNIRRAFYFQITTTKHVEFHLRLSEVYSKFDNEFI